MLQLTQVTKRFGAKQVLTGLDLMVPTGALYGFVGVNGAGKTTTMKLILGLDAPTAGTITIDSHPVRFGAAAATLGVGYLPDVPQFYPELSAREYLQVGGELTHTRDLQTRIGELLRLVELPDTRRRIQGFSRGMKQRLGIASALLNRPRLLIADEPTSALDPAGRREFLDLLASLRGQCTVVMSTHILSDVERVCDYVGILHQGRLAASGPLAELLAGPPALCFDFATVTAAKQAATLLGGKVDGATVTAAGGDSATMAAALTRLLTAHLVPDAVRHQRRHLEDVFMEVTGA